MEHYKSAIEKLHMSDRCEQNIISNIHNSEKKTRWLLRFVRKRAVIVTTAVLLIFCGTVTASGNSVKKIFDGWLTKDEKLKEDVFTSKFTDYDAHVKIRIKEIVSDIKSTKMVVVYSSFDKAGEKWLEKICKKPEDYMAVVPGIKDFDSEKYEINYSVNVIELKEYSTASAKYFELSYDASDIDFGTKTAYLYYSLPSKEIDNLPVPENMDECAVIDLPGALSYTTYQIDGKDTGKNYVPDRVDVSAMGIVIYGKTKNCILSYKMGDFVSSVMLEGEDIDSLYLLLNNGERINLLMNNELVQDIYFSIAKNPEWNAADEKKWKDVVDYIKENENYKIISDGSEGNQMLYSLSFGYALDVDSIKGIEMDGIEYDFAK